MFVYVEESCPVAVSVFLDQERVKKDQFASAAYNLSHVFLGEVKWPN